MAAGSFLGTERQALCRMNAALLREEIEEIEVARPDGGTLLRARLA